jgi:hypothetical protein
MPDPPVPATEGSFGSAEEIPRPPGDDPEWAETLGSWIITAPAYHPLWSQYNIVCVRLRDNVPGFPPPHRQFPGATHEIMVMALNPEEGPYRAATFVETCKKLRGLQWLAPGNIAHQVEGTDEEAGQLLRWAIWGVVSGHLNPETADAPGRIRAGWKESLVKTLAHIRGEEHAQ